MLVSFTPLNVCRSLPFSFRSNPTLENDYYLFLAFFVLPQMFPQHLAKLKIIEKSYKPKFLFSRNNGKAYKHRQITSTEWIRTLFQKLMRKYCGQEGLLCAYPIWGRRWYGYTRCCFCPLHWSLVHHLVITNHMHHWVIQGSVAGPNGNRMGRIDSGTDWSSAKHEYTYV